jgi:hypothetical protein
VALDLEEGDTLRITVQVSEQVSPVVRSRSRPGTVGELAPPPGADRLVLCQTPFRDRFASGARTAPSRSAAEALDAIRRGLAAAEPLPPPTFTCSIGARTWELIWLDGEAVTDRVTVPDATCLAASRADGIAYTVPAPLVGALRALHEAEAGQGGAFQGLADPAPVAALCGRTYPQDLPGTPARVRRGGAGSRRHRPRRRAESPGVPFSDVDLLVLNTYAGQPTGRLVGARPDRPPDPTRARRGAAPRGHGTPARPRAALPRELRLHPAVQPGHRPGVVGGLQRVAALHARRAAAGHSLAA